MKTFVLVLAILMTVVAARAVDETDHARSEVVK